MVEYSVREVGFEDDELIWVSAKTMLDVIEDMYGLRNLVASPKDDHIYIEEAVTKRLKEKQDAISSFIEALAKEPICIDDLRKVYVSNFGGPIVDAIESDNCPEPWTNTFGTRKDYVFDDYPGTLP